MYKRQVLAVDSRSRLNVDMTEPNKYTVKFTPIRNIVMIRLVSTEMPNTMYVINASNNWIDWDDSVLGVVSCELTHGTYTALELANEINLKMNQTVGAPAPYIGMIYTVTYITSTQKMRVDIPGPPPRTYRFLWASGPNKDRNAAFVLGYLVADGVMANTQSSDQPVHLQGDDYAFMCVRSGNVSLGAIAATDNIGHIMAKIVWNQPPRSIIYNSFVTNAIILPMPIDRMETLDVEFRTQDGEYYDFNKFDHSFSLEMYTL